jgi:nitrite reductase/ring-hydroxylating ferredoxin subunit
MEYWSSRMGKILISKTSEIPSGKMHKATIDGKDILVMNYDGNYYAIDDTCTHSGASLSEGKFDDSTVICGWHGAQFDCKSGNLEKFPAKINNLQSYNVIIDADDIYVEV